jgi:hypothetical protein
MLDASHGLPDLVSGELRLGWRSVLLTPALPVQFGTTKEKQELFEQRLFASCYLLSCSLLTYSSFRSSA